MQPIRKYLTACILLTAILYTGTGTAAADVSIGTGTVAQLDDHEVTFDLSQDATRLELDENTVTINDVGFRINTGPDMNITLEEVAPYAADDETTVSFTARAASSGDAVFVLSELFPGTTYRIEQDGSTITTADTDPDGNLQFSAPLGVDRTFDIIKVSPQSFYTPQETVELGLGESLNSYLNIHNSENTPGAFNIDVETNVQDGNAVATILADGQETDTATGITVGADNDLNIPVTYNAASCLTDVCTGEAVFTIRSLDTDEVHVVKTDLRVIRDNQIHGAPGIQTLHLIVLAILASLFVAARRP